VSQEKWSEKDLHLLDMLRPYLEHDPTLLACGVCGTALDDMISRAWGNLPMFKPACERVLVFCEDDIVQASSSVCCGNYTLFLKSD
jgi:hypothetical protein